MRIAVIDIGSNSIRYMEAEHNGNEFFFSKKSVFTTRLAEGLVETGGLSEPRMAVSMEVLKQLARRAADHSLPCFCYATSAVRDANNQNVFLKNALCNAKLRIEVLSGEREAAFARLGAAKQAGALIDIGGGSSQIITETYCRSFPIGCIRVQDFCGEMPLKEMEISMLPRFSSTYDLPDFPALDWTAVGGTATTLAALSLGLTHYEPEHIQEAELSQTDLWELLQKLDDMGDSVRAAHPLLTKRHDVICGGGLILLYLMKRIGIRSVRFSDADGLEGYAMHLLQNMQPTHVHQ